MKSSSSVSICDPKELDDADGSLARPLNGFAGLPWHVHKFGGTSVANATCYLTVARIVEEQLGLPPLNGNGANGNQEPHLSSAMTNDTTSHLAVVVSAMGGKPKVTDLLLDAVSFAAQRDNDAVTERMDLLLTKHAACLEALFATDAPTTRDRLLTIIQKDVHDIKDILKTVALMKWQAERISELVSGYGELWSAQILTALLRHRTAQREAHNHAQGEDEDDQQVRVHHEFVYLDARRVIIIDEEAISDGAIEWNVSQQKLQQVFAQAQQELEKQEAAAQPTAGVVTKLHFVVTGYVASNTEGVATTLKRDGSDYSAAIMGRLLQSNSIQIWTDVDGVLSADPRRVPLAQVLSEVSYNEAMELAYFGAKVIHPKTMQPAILAQPQIPIYIRNTFNPSFRGTRIYTCSTTTRDREKVVCGFTSIDNMALINVEGSGMIGVRGILRRIFSSLEQLGINVILISQASSEHSITFALLQNDAAAAQQAITDEFARELRNNRINKIDIQAPCSIIAAVGDGMLQMSGVSGLFFSALGEAKINVMAVAQGSSERNISAVVRTEDSSRALRAVHAAFRLSHTTIRVAIVGMNELGNSLLQLLQDRRAALRATFEIDLQVVAVVASGNSSETVCLQKDVDGGSDSITLAAFNQVTGGSFLLGAAADGNGDDENGNKSAATTSPGGLTTMMERLIRNECTNHVIFDCTNDEGVAKHHASWLRAGVDIVTANNTGLSGPKEQRDEISQAEKALGKQSAKYLREVTVGGGLPILNTAQTLLETGDKIRRIDGILSVSLSFIMFRMSPPIGMSVCSKFDEQTSRGAFHGDLLMSPSSNIETPCSFSQALKEAMALGLMEEDPTKDLNNEYTSRVLMILARELGIHHVETADIQSESDRLIEDAVDYNNLPADIDQKLKARVDAARARGCVLRQIASVDAAEGRVEVKIVEVPEHHIFAITPPSCECVRFFTHRHRRYPLIVQGPSAGADSTASALLADLLQLMRRKVNPHAVALSRRGTSAKLQAVGHTHDYII